MASDTTASTSRTVTKVVYAEEVPEGIGAVVRRSIGSPALRNLSPFLMLDHGKIPKGAGFGAHPHRGQSTISYMLKGKMQHEDFLGNRGILGPGDLQWMTAGRGIMHAEMPMFDSDDENPEPVEGLQLWVDIPQAKKFCEPSYQEKSASEIDRIHPSDGVEITVISGESHGTTGFVRPVGGCWYFDFKFTKPGATAFQTLPQGWTCFIYIIKGKVAIGDNPQSYSLHNTLVLSSQPGEEGVKLTRPVDTTEDSHFVLIAGEPLDQKVVQYGPFVVNTQQQVQEAIQDFRMGRNGFERAPGWSSSITLD